MSQQERLLERLRKGPITPMEAWSELAIYRVGARVHQLRKDGYSIDTELVEVVNRYGEKCRVAEYRLAQ